MMSKQREKKIIDRLRYTEGKLREARSKELDAYEREAAIRRVCLRIAVGDTPR